MTFWKAWRRPDAAVPDPAALRAAYDEGRKDERRRHRHAPLITLATGGSALLGLGLLTLAARKGSFARGGEAVDYRLALIGCQAQAAGREAALAAALAARQLSRGARDKLSAAANRVASRA